MSAPSSKTPPSQAALTPQAIFYMMLLALQFGTQPLLTRLYTPSTVCRSTVIMMQEVTKLGIGGFMLVSSGTWGAAISGWTFQSWITVALVPAALYCVQNFCALVAYQNLDPLTFNVLNQTKTLSAALCCFLIIHKKQSKFQIVALLLLFLSALVIEKIISVDFLLGHALEKETLIRTAEENLVHLTRGVAPVLAASLISGLAGALTQRNLQGGGRNSILFSMELCVASLLFFGFSLLGSDDGVTIKEHGFFHEWTPATMIPICTSAAGGLIVGLVTKYAGAVRKGFALIFGLLLSGVVQAVFGGEGVRAEQILGGVLAGISLWMHSSYPYKAASGVSSSSLLVGDSMAKQEGPKRPGRKARKED